MTNSGETYVAYFRPILSDQVVSTVLGHINHGATY